MLGMKSVVFGFLAVVLVLGVLVYSFFNSPSYYHSISQGSSSSADEPLKSVISEVRINSDSGLEKRSKKAFLDSGSTTDNVPISSSGANNEVIQKVAAPKPTPVKKHFLRLYPSSSGKYPVFSTMELNKDVAIFPSDGEWTQIISAKGIPVWIKAELVKEQINGYVEVVVGRANARSAPDKLKGAIVGALDRGELLKVNRKKDGWVRVWSPIRFRAWVKTSDLKMNQ